MKQKKVMILGGSGFLGSNLVSLFHGNENYEVMASFNIHKPNLGRLWFKFEIGDVANLKNIIDDFKPDLLLNCIALANVENCELNFSSALSLNAEFPKHLAVLCDEMKIKLIHISTDHYFSEIKKPRNESAAVQGINNYGISKLIGEDNVLKFSSSLVVRVNFFGFGNSVHKSSLDNLIKDIEVNRNLNGFTNIFFTPVSIELLYEYLLCFFDLEICGLVNIASSNEISKYSFMKLISNYFPNYTGKIIPMKFVAGDFGLVQRPEYMSLDSSYADQLVNSRSPTVEKMVNQVLFKLTTP